MDKILYLDCFAGISGDMLVGSLLDLGLDLEVLRAELAKIPIGGYELQAESVQKRGIQATQFKVLLDDEAGSHLADSEYREMDAPGWPGESPEHRHGGHPAHGNHEHHVPHRELSEILEVIDSSKLSGEVKKKAARIFRRLGQAEAKVHGMADDRIFLHEVGGVDAIIDIVGSIIGLQELGVGRVYASRLPLGTGYVRASHGILPVPAPATTNLLVGIPVYAGDIPGELVTPTGAALISTIAEQFGPMPPMIIEKIGYGSGTRDREIPNVLRAILGTLDDPALRETLPEAGREPHPEQHLGPLTEAGYRESPAVVLEANIDDMVPQFYGHLVDRLLDAGALDVALIPVQMKKGRPGTMLQVLARPDSVPQLLALIFSETTTIGVRTYSVTKHMLPREIRTVQTRLGTVRVKIARLGDQITNIQPEYEDCRELALRHGLPIKEVYELTLEAARAQVRETGSKGL